MIDPVKAAMIRALFPHVRSQTAANFVVTGYIAGTAWAYSAHGTILAWAAVMLAVVALRWGLARAFLARERPDGALMTWASLYALSMAVIGALYGLSFLLFAHPDQPITVALTLAALYSVGAGSTPPAAYHQPAIYGAVAPIFAAVLGKLLLAGSVEYILLGSASALYGVTMIGYCRMQARTLKEGFTIRFENAELLEQLRRETAIADEARRAAEQANLAKSQFLAAASHDLRQPLYALGLFSSSLEDLSLDSGGRDVVRRIQDSIGAMEHAFEGLLDLSKLEAGVVQPRLQPVAVDALFDRIDQVFGPLAAERGLSLRFRSDGEVVRSDPALLEQVLGNLVSNALRATTRGGVLVAARPRAGALRFEIWDTGRGIAPADLERIFGDYVQLDNPERDRKRGFGLGLAIAQRSVGLLGARIDVASRVGVGSRFGFSQERWAQGDVAPTRARSETIGPLRRGDGPLLLVEDDEDVRAALANLLTRWGFAFDAVADALSALDLLTGDRRYSLIITDQRLAGGMTGLELIHATRMALADPPPAIIITGEIDSPLLKDAGELSIPVLHKPVQAQTLRLMLGGPAGQSPDGVSP
jgi:signal transduction histidine kinase/CheY-like chemotaxis protein